MATAADMAWSDPLYIAAPASSTDRPPTGFGSGPATPARPGRRSRTLPPARRRTRATKRASRSRRATRRSGRRAKSVPSYTTDNGATWTPTNLPRAGRRRRNRGYHLVADRKNPNKVYAYDSGGALVGHGRARSMSRPTAATRSR